jgi:endo-beta-N-acetylglucosaminidase D
MSRIQRLTTENRFQIKANTTPEISSQLEEKKPQSQDLLSNNNTKPKRILKFDLTPKIFELSDENEEDSDTTRTTIPTKKY